LINEVIFHSLLTQSEIKRASFRAIILNYARGKPTKEHEVDLMMSLATTLSQLQIEMLLHARPTNADPDDPAKETLNEHFPEASVGILRAAYLDLVQKGLIWQPFRNDYRDLKPIPISRFNLTELGAVFLEWIKECPTA
jgi:hypothetical protein